MTNVMYTVFGRATSSNVQALLWGLEELWLAYNRLDYGENFGGLDTLEFRAMNPHGKIPVLKLGGRAIFETPAILRYLAAEHGTDQFWPSDPLKRSEVDMWAEWAKHDIAEAFTGPVFWEAVRKCAANRDPDLIQRNLARFENQLALVDPRLSKTEFICGSVLTLADIQFGHVLYRYFDAGLKRRDLPAVANYYERLKTRTAYRKTVMISYEALQNTL